MTTISNNDIARAIYAVSLGKRGHELSSALEGAVRFLSRKHLLSQSPDILLKLEKVINKEEGRTVVRVSSAKKLDERTRTHLAHTFEKRSGAKEVVLIETLDDKLLGGMRLESGDEVIDLSVRNKIKKLKEHLTRSHE